MSLSNIAHRICDSLSLPVLYDPFPKPSDFKYMQGNNKIDNTYNIFVSAHVGIATGSMQYAKKHNSLNIYNPHANSFVPSLLFMLVLY